MKIFSEFLELLKSKKIQNQICDQVSQYLADEEKYINMSLDDLKTLSDEELFDAIFRRLEHKASEFEELSDALATFNHEQKAFYALYLLEIEVNNGGLCQYFVNSSRATAPYVRDAMVAVGALEHQALFESFIAKTDIDLSDLSSFIISDLDEYEEQLERYPFDEYDDAFYDLEPIQSYLEKFARVKVTELY